MLLKGQLGTATLPEPFATHRVKQVASVVTDDGAERIGQSVLSVRREVLREKSLFADCFLVAYE